MKSPKKISASHGVAKGNFRLYSNTSDDALGLSGALADMGAILSRAEKAILITGWKFSPELQLPFFHEALRAALVLHQAENFDEAKALYDEVICDFPSKSIESNYARYFKAMIFLQAGKWDEADQLLQRCIANEPNNIQFLNTQLSLFILQKKWDEAKLHIELREDTTATNARFFTLCGDFFTKTPFSVRQAEAYYQRALFEDDECIGAMRGLAKLYLNENDNEKAIIFFNNILGYFPMDADTHLHLAKLYFAKNDIASAKKHIDLVLATKIQTAEVLTLRTKIGIAQGFIDGPTEKQNMQYHAMALEKDCSNFLLQYQKAIAFRDKVNDLAAAKDLLRFCAQLDPVALRACLKSDEKWSADLPAQLELDYKIALFSQKLEDNSALTLAEKISFYSVYVKNFPYARDAFFILGELYQQNNDHKNAFAYFYQAEQLEPYDAAYLHKVILCMKELNLDEADAQLRSEEITALQAFMYREKNYEGNFYDSYADFREQLPSIGALLIHKAVANPEMVIALQLWNRVGLHDTDPLRTDYYEKIELELKKIHANLYPGKQFPQNLLLRFTNCQGAGSSHHQKYCIVDTGDDYPTAFYGSMDLTCGKLDWSEHPLSNTEVNNGAVSRAHIFNKRQNIRHPNDSDIVLPWREVVSSVSGPVAVDMVDAFNSRWQAAGHGTMRGQKGNRNQKSVAEYRQALGSPTVSDGASSVHIDSQVLDETAGYRWKGQVLLSTKRDYTRGEQGFFTQSECTSKEASIKDAMLSVIANAERYIYIETQYLTDVSILNAIAKRIREKNETDENFHVYCVLPFCPNGDPGGKVFVEPVRQLQWKLIQECMQKIENDTQKPWHTYLTPLFFAQWEGVASDLQALHKDGRAHTRGELMNHSYRCPVYIHSKLMVVDDKTVINGSANLNERSLDGAGDTEIAVMQIPEEGYEEVCQAEIVAFMRDKILAPYFGHSTVQALSDASSMDGALALESPAVVAHIQSMSMQNYTAFASNEPGHAANAETGKVVSFPFVRRECGHIGKLEAGCEFVPDAPLSRTGQSLDIYRWIPPESAVPLVSTVVAKMPGAK